MSKAVARRGSFSRMNAWLFRFGTRRSVHGLDVAAPGWPWPVAYRRLCLDRVTAAVELIAERDPRRLARIARDASRVVIGWVSASDGCFDPATQLVVLDADTVTRDGMTAAQLALLLAHEATHARIERAGTRYEPARRARIERVCLRSELAFAERLTEPDRAWHTGHLRRALSDPPGDFSDEAFVERYAASARAAGLPAWLVERGRRRMLRRLASTAGKPR